MKTLWLIACSALFWISFATSSHAGTVEDGRGVWLWYIEQTGFSHEQLADKLSDLGVKKIFIKVADGTSLWREATNIQIPKIYKERGITPIAWSYNYPGNDMRQAQALYAAARAGYEGYALDIEIEFNRATTALHNIFNAFTRARDAARQDGHIIAEWPLLCTTWGNPATHGMRIDIIDRYVDAHLPQTYLENWGRAFPTRPEHWISVGTQEYKRLGATKPIFHIGSVELNRSSAADLNRFLHAAGPNSSLWRIPGGNVSQTVWRKLEQLIW